MEEALRVLFARLIDKFITEGIKFFGRLQRRIIAQPATARRLQSLVLNGPVATMRSTTRS